MFFIKGIYNKGFIKKTAKQEKKHRIQMTFEELYYLSNLLKKLDLNQLHFSKHALTNNVSSSIHQIRKILLKENLYNLIIEYNKTQTAHSLEHRVLIRDNEDVLVTYNPNTTNEFKEISNFCFVICLNNSRIITTYYNISTDTHKTLNLNRYSNNLNILDNIKLD
ncbi:hypothetical protein ACSW8U_16050 (plasmid) [Clostridium perfringens]